MTLLKLFEILESHDMHAKFMLEPSCEDKPNYVISLTKNHDGTASHRTFIIPSAAILATNEPEELIKFEIIKHVNELEHHAMKVHFEMKEILAELRND